MENEIEMEDERERDFITLGLDPCVLGRNEGYGTNKRGVNKGARLAIRSFT